MMCRMNPAQTPQQSRSQCDPWADGGPLKHFVWPPDVT